MSEATYDQWTLPTVWVGIYVQYDHGHYWIMDDNGGEHYHGTTCPTPAAVDAYRESCLEKR